MVNSNGISFSGLASGLDSASIINQLVALERIPIQAIERQKADAQSKLDKLGAFEDLVKALQDAAQKLSTPDSFFAFAIAGGDETVAKVTATGFASKSEGSHTLEVTSLAAADRWAFDGVADPDALLASADGESVSFTVNGTDYTVTVDQASSSLNDIAAAINDQAGDDVTATVVNAGTDAAPDYRLVLASDETGEDFRLSNISSSVAGLTISYSAPDVDGNATSANNITVGNNAVAVIDGLAIERTSNDFSDVLPGVEIGVLSTTTGPITFVVEPDKEAIRGNIDAFVEAYNGVINFINQQNTFTPSEEEGEAGTSGLLFGDSILTSVRANVRRALFDVDPADVMADTLGFSTLGLVGLETNNDGTLQVNEAVLDEKMAEDLDAFADLFVDSDGFDNGGAEPNTPGYFTDLTADSGVMANLVREIDRMFGTFEGALDEATGERVVFDALFDAKESTYRDNIRRYEDQIEAMERRLESFESNLVLRFARLEEIMGALNSQGAALNAALLGLPS